MGTAFPLLSYGENAYILLKMHFAVQKDVFLTLKYGKTRWWPGLRPGPRWGSLRVYYAPPDPLVGWEGDTPPKPHLAQRLRRSILGAGASNFGVPIVVNLRNDHWFICATDYDHVTLDVPQTLEVKGLKIKVTLTSLWIVRFRLNMVQSFTASQTRAWALIL